MSDDVTPLRWLCVNCDTINETTLEYYVERSEAVGDEETEYNDYCEVCCRGVWDVRKQPKPPLGDEASIEARSEVGG